MDETKQSEISDLSKKITLPHKTPASRGPKIKPIKKQTKPKEN